METQLRKSSVRLDPQTVRLHHTTPTSLPDKNAIAWDEIIQFHPEMQHDCMICSRTVNNHQGMKI